jgi:galactose oxidase-like protein
MRRSHAGLLALVTAAAGVPAVGLALPAGATATSAKPAAVGSFGRLFEESKALKGDVNCRALEDKTNCKPAAMAIAQLADGRLVFWDGLEGMNNANVNVVGQFGETARNDQSRVLSFVHGQPKFTVPKNNTADFGTLDGDYLPGVPHNNSPGNDSDLFCASLVQLGNGQVLAAGGTGYYEEPGVPGTQYGVAELEGLKVSRLFDPVKNAWLRSGDMHYGRWYPSLVTLPNGRVFVASGVTKLIKPAYPNDPAGSGTNVKQTEIYNPKTKAWTANKASAAKSLPLFPRLHLLPDGKVYYDAGGQTFNPAGQSYDEALWNLASVYDPKTQTWTNLGVPKVAGLPLGFRGSAFSVMLPLQADAKGRYTKARVLSAGGVIGVSPGTYVATNSSTLNTIDTANGDALTSTATGNLNNRRWYTSGVVLPTGQVFAINGASADEVVNPGSAFPVTQAELFDPATNKWSVAATETHGRTYHNSATLLPDGRVLVGGHAPIGTGYAFETDAGAQAIGTSKAESDPTFQIYSPPYLSWGARPVISKAAQAVHYGARYVITTSQAKRIASVAFVRNTSVTHLVDGDQRTVDLRILRRTAHTVTVAVPNAKVLPPGPYMVFVNAKTAKGLVPSVSRQAFVGTKVPAFALTRDGRRGTGATHGGGRLPRTGAPVASGPAASVAATGRGAAAVVRPGGRHGATVEPARMRLAAHRGSSPTAPWTLLTLALVTALGVLHVMTIGRRRPALAERQLKIR